MAAEVEVHGGGEVSSPKVLPNGKANADRFRVFVNGNDHIYGDVGSEDPVGADRNYNSVELIGKPIVEEGNHPLIDNEDNECVCEKLQSLIIVSEGDVDQENERVNLSDKEGELGDQSIDVDPNFEAAAESGAVMVNDSIDGPNFEAAAESGAVMVNDSIDGDEAVSLENGSSENAQTLPEDLPAETACENGEVQMIYEIIVADSWKEHSPDIEQYTEAASCPVAYADLQLDSCVVSGTVTEESGHGLDTGHYQCGVSDTFVDFLVDPRKETAEVDKSLEVADNFPFQIVSKSVLVETAQTDTDVAVGVSYTTAKPDEGFGDSAVTESYTSCEVGVKRDTEVGNLNVGSGGSSDCHHVDDADAIETESGPIGDDIASGGPNGDAKSEIKTGFDSVEAEEKVSNLVIDELNTEPKVSKGVIIGVDEQPISVHNAAGESFTSDSVEKENTSDVKAESALENASVVSCSDMPGHEVVSEFEVMSESVTSTPDDVNVENGGIQSTGGESDQRYKEVEDDVEIQLTDGENDDQGCKEVEENGGIQSPGCGSDDTICQEVEENGGIQSTGGGIDYKTFQEVEENGGIQSTGSRNDDKTCQEVEGNVGIQFTGGENNDKTYQEIEKNGAIKFTGDENDDIYGAIKFTGDENDDESCLKVGESAGIQVAGVEVGDRTCQEVEGIDGSDRGETQTSIPEGSTVDAYESQNVGAEVAKRPFFFLIKVPRYDDKNLREQIKSAQSKVDEKTRSRDAIRDEIQMIRATYKEYAEKLESAILEERAARDVLKSKRQYIDSVQSEITKAKKVISADDIDGRIRNTELRIAHETLHLKEEKQFIREIKQLKQLREQLSSDIGKQDEIQEAFDQKNKLEVQLKLLRKETDSLKENVMKAEAATQAVKKKHREESEKLKRLFGQFKDADEIRQEAYKHLQSLKKQAYDKNKQFWKYKDDAKQAYDLVFKGDRDALQHLCVNQVERVLELWNNNDEFRKEYVNSNIRSTLRRLKTLDGRSLGPDEEAPVIHPVVNDRIAKNFSMPQISAPEREQREQPVPANSEKFDKKIIREVQDKTNQIVKSKKSAMPSCLDNVSAPVSGRDDEIDEAKEEEQKITMEEEEMARKAEEKRSEEAAALLREQHRLEEKAKAQEALVRKKRIAEKAQARALLRAQKEAEQKEKEREKRAMKKKKREAAATEVTAVTNEESSPSWETPLEVPQSSELREKATTTMMKKPQNFIKQSKTKSIPLSVRNRSKRRMRSWMWAVMASIVVSALLFVLGNSRLSFRFGLEGLGF